MLHKRIGTKRMCSVAVQATVATTMENIEFDIDPTFIRKVIVSQDKLLQ